MATRDSLESSGSFVMCKSMVMANFVKIGRGKCRAVLQLTVLPGESMNQSDNSNITQVSPPVLSIEVVSDVVCPWCYVGKRQIEQALETFRETHPETPVRLSWRPFQLNPAMPPEGVERADYLRSKFGTANVGARYERVTAAGTEAGVTLHIDKIGRVPNTLIPHALIAAAGEARGDGDISTAVEVFFNAYFVEGQDLCHPGVLKALAVQAGLSAEKAQAVLDDPAHREAVAEQDLEFRDMGVSGVPFFIFNRKLAVNGAQGPERLLEAMTAALNSKD